MRVRPYRCRSKTGRIRVVDKNGANHTILDERGQTVGELKVLEFVEVNEHGIAIFLCQCSCGKTCEVTGGAFRARNYTNTRSCGHLQKDWARTTGPEQASFKHGHASNATIKTYWKTHYKQVLADKKRQLVAT